MTSPGRRWSLRAALLVLGVYTALLSLVVHRQVSDLVGLDLPWGLVLGVASVGVVAAASQTLDDNGAAASTLGWFIGVIATLTTGGASYLLASDALGLAYALGCVVVLCFLLFRLPRRR